MKEKAKPLSTCYLSQLFSSTNNSKYQRPNKNKFGLHYQNSKSQFQMPLLNTSLKQTFTKNSHNKAKTPQTIYKSSNISYKTQTPKPKKLHNEILQQFTTNPIQKQSSHTILQNEFLILDAFKNVDSKHIQNGKIDQQRKFILREEIKNVKQHNTFLINEVRTFHKKYKKYKELCQFLKNQHQKVQKELQSTINMYRILAVKILDQFHQSTSVEKIKTEITPIIMTFLTGNSQKNSPKIYDSIEKQSKKDDVMLASVGSPYFKTSKQSKQNQSSLINLKPISVNPQEKFKQQQISELTKLNQDFENNMKKYKETKNINYRKNCIELANKIKQIKAVDETIRTMKKNSPTNNSLNKHQNFSQNNNNCQNNNSLKVNFQKNLSKHVGQSVKSLVSQIMDEKSINLLQEDEMYNYQYRNN